MRWQNSIACQPQRHVTLKFSGAKRNTAGEATFNLLPGRLTALSIFFRDVRSDQTHNPCRSDSLSVVTCSKTYLCRQSRPAQSRTVISPACSQTSRIACSVREVRSACNCCMAVLRHLACCSILSQLYLVANREEDAEELVCLQAKAFYDPWDNAWIDDFLLKLFEVSITLSLPLVWLHQIQQTC